MNNRILCIAYIILLLSCFSITAQNNKIKDKSYIYNGIGRLFALPKPQTEISAIETSIKSLLFSGTTLRDTYLSPNDYIGISIGYRSTNIKPLEIWDFSKAKPKGSIFAYIPQKRLSNWLSISEVTFLLGNTSNNTRNRSMIYFDLDLQKSILYTLAKGYMGSLHIGAGLDVGIGAIYNSSNGNNPASLKLHSALVGSALYHYRIPFKAIPIGLTLYYTSSVAGLTFSPQYGASYYEIFSLQDNGLFHNIHFTSLDKVLNNKLRFDIEIPYFDWFNINIGLFYNGYYSRINDINTKLSTIGFNIGFTNYKQNIGGRGIYNSSKYQVPL